MNNSRKLFLVKFCRWLMSNRSADPKCVIGKQEIQKWNCLF